MTDAEDDGRETGADDRGNDAIRELAELAEPTTVGFRQRVRNSIFRRDFSADLLDYAWTAPFRVLWEYVELVFDLIGGSSGSKEDKE